MFQVLHRAGEHGTAVLHQARALALYERLLGVDHPETAHAHGNLALFHHTNGDHKRAFSHMRRCLELLELAGAC